MKGGGFPHRACGVLMPVFSLPSAYGIGAFSKEAYDFIDFLSDAGQSYWQILPLGPTGYGDSPYQSFSTFAGNLFFIDIERLIDDGMLSRAATRSAKRKADGTPVDYNDLHRRRRKLIRKAYEASGLSIGSGSAPPPALKKDFNAFVRAEKDWLEDYALFIALKDATGGKPWNTWEKGLRLRQKKALDVAREKHAEQINFVRFSQYLVFKQYDELKRYANDKGIGIIGDIPIYVAYDGADCWSNPSLFLLDKDGLPVEVAGCPPDAFSKTGQLWGNPIYRWEEHYATGFKWWEKRMEAVFRTSDAVRIDHFRGFESFYCIPYGAKTAIEGEWRKGPGMDLFNALKGTLSGRAVIAEDLGFLTPAVHRLLKKSGYPGMKVLQFAFDSREESDYLPHNYGENCVVYTGTHDNQTTVGWVKELNRHDKAFAKRYLGVRSDKNLTEALIRAALMSVGRTAIIPMQDYLKLGAEARINLPSTIGNNWSWRMRGDALNDDLAEKMRELAKLYGRYRRIEDG